MKKKLTKINLYRKWYKK